MRALAVALAALLLSACGGPITDDELERGIDTLGATAAEGELVARDAVSDRTKATFVRVSARDLAEDAEHEAEKLADATAQPGNAGVKEEAVKLAQKVGAALGDLQVRPADRATAHDVQQKLEQLSKQAERLTEDL